MIEAVFLIVTFFFGIMIGIYIGTTNGYHYALSKENKKEPIVVRVEQVGDFFHANNYSDDMFLARSNDLRDLQNQLLRRFPEKKVIMIE